MECTYKNNMYTNIHGDIHMEEHTHEDEIHIVGCTHGNDIHMEWTYTLWSTHTVEYIHSGVYTR